MSELDYPLYFMQTMREFLTAMSEVYPECISVRGYALAFRTQTARKSEDQIRELGTEAIRTFKAVMEPWFQRCCEHDESLLGENIKFLKDLKLPDKWPTMDRGTKASVWQFIIQLNHMCGGPAPQEEQVTESIEFPDIPMLAPYTDSLPDGVKKQIMDMSQDFVEKMGTGEMESINLMEMTTALKNAMTPEDVLTFHNNLTSNNVTVNVGELMSTLQQMPVPGGVDIAGLMNMDMNMNGGSK